MSAIKMPVIYLPHGGGPWSYVDFGVPADEVETLVRYWRSISELPARKPEALLVISAHWEAAVPTLMTSPHPPMLYDYSGFPPPAYELQWSAPGSPAVAGRVQRLLEGAGFQTAEDPERGFDHGTFVPLGRSFPDADIPCTQLSLKAGLDPQEHLEIGRALAPLRDEGVLILGSGMSYHDMRGFMSPQAEAVAQAFDTWLQQMAVAPAAERDRQLAAWTKAPQARRAHPREEHLLPLMVVAGAAGDDRGSVPFTGRVFGKTVSAIHFGV